jgi:thioredoxin-dependent peroxiredoxin
VFRQNSFVLQVSLLGFLTASSLVAGCDRKSPAASSASGATAPASSLSPATSVAAPSAPPVPARGTLLAVGAEVPDVSAPAHDGTIVRLRALKGKPLVIYFYPKDDTPGCTVEAKGIRDQYAELSRRAVVLGVSEDSLDSHKAFASKYELPFPLLDDTSHELASAFGVPLSSGHAKRVTFVIDAAGKVNKVFPNVNPDGHATELIEALKTLG